MNGVMAIAEAQTIHALPCRMRSNWQRKIILRSKQQRPICRSRNRPIRLLLQTPCHTISGTITTTAYLQLPVSIIPKDAFAPGQPAEPQAVSFTPKYNATAGVTLKQTLFDGQVFVGLKARTTALDYSRKEIDLAVENMSVNVYKVYYQLLVSRTQVQLLDANIVRAAKITERQSCDE